MSKGLAMFVTLVCVCMIAAGQIMFKLVANRSVAGANMSLVEQWLSWQFFVALLIYGAATILWIWVLRFIPLNVAYPVFALAFIVVPVAAYFLLNEPIGIRHLVGGVLIVSGVVVIARG